MSVFKRDWPLLPAAMACATASTLLIALWTTHASASASDEESQTGNAAPAVMTHASQPAQTNVTYTAETTSPSPAEPSSLPTAASCTPAITPETTRRLNGPRQFALGMIETGNDDHAVGRAGEVSRFQIMPSVWEHYSNSRSYRSPEASLEVARSHWAWLYDYFKRAAGREPTDFDMYVLWNTRHGYYAKRGFASGRLGPIVRDRAMRFNNLVEEAARRAAESADAPRRG